MSVTVNKTRLPGSVIQTESGAVVSVSDARMRGAIGVEASFSPRQDLHGYVNPWVGGAGKNILPDDMPSNAIHGTMTGGTIATATNSWIFSLPCKENTSYVFSQGTRSTWAVGFSNNPVPVLGDAVDFRGNMNNRDRFIQNSNSNVYIYIQVSNTATWDNHITNQWQIEVGSSQTAWEPYENLCPISGITSASAFVSQQYPDANPRSVTAQLGETRYGGTYDFVRGKLTLTWKYFNLPKTGWLRFTYDNGRYFLYKSIPYTDITTTDRINFLCDSLKPVSAVGNDTTMGVISLATTTGLIRCRPFETVAEWEAYLAEHDVHICFKIDPIVIDMTPAEFELFHKNNFVWSDVGDTKLTYAAIHEHGG